VPVVAAFLRGLNEAGYICAAFAAFVQRQVAALLVVNSPFFVTRGNYLISLAARFALPTLYFRRELAVAGGLISYGSSTAELYGQMGIYAGKILNGAKPADLPMVQPTQFELVINLKTLSRRTSSPLRSTTSISANRRFQSVTISLQ
jgi:ABC-type uncharacterized transport system substrate-binding protein